MRLLRWLIIPTLAGGMLAYGAAEKSDPQSGEAIYRQKCGGCHGLDGKAESTMGKNWKMRDLTSPEVQKQPDSALVTSIANGRGHMPAYELILGNERIQAVVAYIRELGKK
jgi:mono/diheme cytochrome c family protein